MDPQIHFTATAIWVVYCPAGSCLCHCCCWDFCGDHPYFHATQRAEKYSWESDAGKWYVDKYSQVDGCQILQRESKNSPTTTAKMAKLRYQVSPVAFCQHHTSPSLSPPLMLHFADVCALATLLTSYTSSTVGTNMAALCVWKFLIELAELRAYMKIGVKSGDRSTDPIL